MNIKCFESGPMMAQHRMLARYIYICDFSGDLGQYIVKEPHSFVIFQEDLPPDQCMFLPRACRARNAYRGQCTRLSRRLCYLLHH